MLLFTKPTVHDPEFFAFMALKLKAPRIADIGVNQGQSIVSFKNMFPNCTIDNYEPNPVHEERLRSVAERFRDGSVRVH
ncbi:MAG: hypothetical protein JO110_28530, partial [Acetobacteraceae bacterium]|nr:hypothetical protein [Acetobacteraceae bacterium]